MTECVSGLGHLEARLERAEGAERVPVLAEIAWLTRDSDPERAARSATEACRLAEDDPAAPASAQARALLALAWSNTLEGDYGLARGQISRAVKLPGGSEEIALRAVASLTVGNLELRAGEPGRAVPALGEALALYEEAADAAGQGQAHDLLAGALFQQGDVERAEEHFERSERLMGDDADPAAIGRIQLNLAAIRYRKGDLPAALRGIQKSMAMLEKARDPKGVGLCQANLSRIYRDLGESQKALDLILQSLEAVRASEDRAAEARILAEVARTHIAMESMEDALEAARESLAISREIDRPYSEAEALDALGAVYMDLGRDEEAIDSLERSLEVNRAMGNRKGEGDCLYLIGEVLLRTGETDKAASSLEASLAAHRELGNRRGEGWTLLAIGKLRTRAGENAPALQALEEADRIAKALEYKSLAVEAGEAKADLHSSAGRYKEALDSHRRFRNLERELDGEKSEARIKRMKSLHEADWEEGVQDLREQSRRLVGRINDARRALEAHSRETLERALEDLLANARLIEGLIEDLPSKGAEE